MTPAPKTSPSLPMDALTLRAFEVFWQAYPRKVGKLVAQAKYCEIVTAGMTTKILDRSNGEYRPAFIQSLPEEILTGATAYAIRCREIEDRKFIKHPTTWLNGGHWLDDPEGDAELIEKTKRLDALAVRLRAEGKL